MTSEGPLRSPGYHLWHAAMAWRSAVSKALGGGLTATQFFVLGAVGWLQKTSGAPTQAQVAAFAGVDAMTTSQVVRALQKARLVERSDDPEDTRRWRLKVTALGRERVVAGAAKVREVDRRFFSGVDASTSSVFEQLDRSRKDQR